MNEEDGTPEHVKVPDWDYGILVPRGSISLRDWFAGMALQGIIAHYGFVTDGPEKSFTLADAMLVEKNKGTNESVS